MNHAESFLCLIIDAHKKIPACKKALRYIHAPPPSTKSHEHHKPVNIKPANIIALNITFKKIDNTLNLMHIHEKMATSQQEPLN